MCRVIAIANQKGGVGKTFKSDNSGISQSVPVLGRYGHGKSGKFVKYAAFGTT